VSVIDVDAILNVEYFSIDIVAVVAVVVLYCPARKFLQNRSDRDTSHMHTSILENRILQYHVERFMNYVTTAALGTTAVRSSLVGKVIPMQRQQQLTSYCAS
jgi:low affinity Fe/Cu permease